MTLFYFIDTLIKLKKKSLCKLNNLSTECMVKIISYQCGFGRISIKDFNSHTDNENHIP